MIIRAILPLLALWPALLLAHESRPAYLELNETEPGRYELLWKIPRRGDLVMPLTVELPAECADLLPAGRYPMPGGLIERRALDCGPAGLTGRTIGVDGLSATITDVLARVTTHEGSTQTVILKPSSPSFEVAGDQSWNAVLAAYLVLGIEHILLGIDHLLFVLGLLLLVSGVGLLIKTITAFTVAHSITLGLAALGFVRVPQAPVEAVIALSILFLASELARRQAGNIGLTEQYPWVVAFSFGLLHGFGFAGALSEVGLPEADIPLALFAFNIGVEIGQLIFVAVALTVITLLKQLHVEWPRWALKLPAYGIGTLAAFWCIQRVAAF